MSIFRKNNRFVSLTLILLFAASLFTDTSAFAAPRNTKSQTSSTKQRYKPRNVGKTVSSATTTPTGPRKHVVKRKTPTPTTRSIAVHALSDVTNKKIRYATRRLEKDPNYLKLDTRDKAFTRLLVLTTERHCGQIDKVLRSYMASNPRFRDHRKLEMICQATLRIGATQLLFMNVAEHAAVKETVQVLKILQSNTPGPVVKFVNAILRHVQQSGKEKLEETSLVDNFQPWFLAKLKVAYGEEITAKICQSVMEEPNFYVSVMHPFKSTVEQRQENLQRVCCGLGHPEAPAQILPIGSILVPKKHAGEVSKWPLYDKGDWFVQDISATLPAIVLFNALSSNGSTDVSAMNVVDLCCAPGGKTAQLCSLGFNKVTAVDVNRMRIGLMTQNLNRLSIQDRCEIVYADGTKWTPNPNEHGKVSGVLLDVPCSATGVACRRPDVLKKSESEILHLVDIQQKLAINCVDNILAPGNVMVYATCSLLKIEGEYQIHQLLAREEGAELETVPITPNEVPGFEDSIDENGWLRVLPKTFEESPTTKCDGFFVARLRRVR